MSDSNALSDAHARLIRLEGYLAGDPGNRTLLSEVFELALRLGEFVKAESVVDRVLEIAPDEPSFLFKQGTLRLAQGQYAVASEIFSRLYDQGTRFPGVSYNLAYALLAESRPQEALAALERLTPQEIPEVPELGVLKARTLYLLTQYEEALECINAYLGAHPGDLDALGLKAMLLLDVGRSSEAGDLAAQVLAARPNDTSGHLVMGSIALENKDAAVAYTHFEQVVKLAPHFGRAWSGLGFAALLKQDPKQALGYFQESVRHMKEHLGTWHGLAWTRILLGDLPGARQAVESAMSIDRNFADNHGTLAVLSIFEGHPDEAEASVKRGLRLNPASPSSLFARSLLLSGAGDVASSRQLVDRILTDSGLQGNAMLREGAAKFVSGFWSARKKN